MGLMKDRTTKEISFFAIRFFLIVFGFVTSLVVAQPVSDNQLPNPLIFLGLVPVMLIFVLGIQFINPKSGSTWQPPSWWVNPFNFSQPYQFFHLAFYFFLASGVGLIISSTYSASSLKYGLCQLAMGLGGITGIKIAKYIYARKNP